jgi:hypothetical protein
MKGVDFTVGILSGNPKDEPLHYGEIFSVWSFSTKAKGAISCYQLYYNHAGDHDLKKLINDAIAQARLEVNECDALLKSNGINPSPELPDRAEVKVEDIPAGAKFMDQEIATAMAFDIAAGMVACSQIIGSSIREDIPAQFAKYHTAKMALNARILRMSKEKGWLVPPPLQVKRPEKVTV